jgi:UDP-N-acetylmuramoyl-tripeptide--D-alanyl-D-alanine ligase
MSLWHWSELLSALELQTPDRGPDIHGVSIDSRSLQNGDLFIALAGDPGSAFNISPGNARDGHDFLEQAINAGASGLLISRTMATQVPALCVGDTLDGLWRIGQAARARMSGQVVAVTGSAGKTTARHWLEHALSSQGVTHASVGSLNNHWGVPLSLARMDRSTEYGVFEIGMNHAGEIAPLSRLVSPSVAVIVSVLPAHIGNMGSIEAIRDEKLSIQAGLNEDGTLVLPDDLAHLCRDQLKGRRIMTFGFKDTADIRIEQSATATSIVVQGQRYPFQFSVPGTHRLSTALAVVAAVHAIGADVAAAIDTLCTLEVPDGRGNHETIRGVVVIDDSYNANPVSMRMAVQALGTYDTGRRIAFLGEMLELGEQGAGLHKMVAEQSADADIIYTFGDGFRDLASCFEGRHGGHFDVPSKFDLTAFCADLRPGDVVLVKGANKVFWADHFVSKLKNRLRELTA